MAIYLLTSDLPTDKEQIDQIEIKLKTIIPELRKIAKIEDIAAEIRAGNDTRIVVIYVSPDLSQISIEKIINVADRYRHRVFFVLVSNEISGADYKRLIRSGGADWVAANGSLQEISELLYKRTEIASDDAKSSRTIVSFVPSMGGVGNTTIALEVALGIKVAKATKSWRVCYVDFDFQTSHVCDYLDIEARLQIADIIDHPERLDEQLFELFVSHHSSGLDVVAAPRSKLDPCNIDANVLDPLLQMILDKYDYIIFDMPVSWFDWTIPTLENCSAIILTGINTIPCLRQMRTTMDAILNARSTSSKVAIVMNRVTHNLFGGVQRRAHIHRVFPKDQILYVEDDVAAIGRVNTGTPAALGAGHSKYFAKITEYCSTLRQLASTKK